MARLRGGSYGHRWKCLGHDDYRLSWDYDTKIAGSRLRFPRTITRDTDKAGAVRFAKKWGIAPPE